MVQVLPKDLCDGQTLLSRVGDLNGGREHILPHVCSTMSHMRIIARTEQQMDVQLNSKNCQSSILSTQVILHILMSNSYPHVM